MDGLDPTGSFEDTGAVRSFESTPGPERKTWAVAIEDRASPRRGGRVHAYDLVRHTIPHPLGSRHTVHDEQIWSDELAGPRCLHCLEIVNRYDITTNPHALDALRIWDDHR